MKEGHPTTGAPSPHPLAVEAGGVEAQCGTGALRGPLQPPGCGGATCEVALHATTPRPRTSEVCIVICVDATPFWKASATRGDVYIDLAYSTHSLGRPSLWSTWLTFDGSDDADPLRLADKLGQLDAQVVELQPDWIATPTVTVEVECFFTGDGKAICARHTKLKCRSIPGLWR